MNTLLDGLIDTLPLMGELRAVHLPHELVQSLVQLVPLLFMMGASLVTVAVLKILGFASMGAFLTLMGGHLVTQKSQSADSTVNIEVGKMKIGWQGAGALGLIVAGILLIALGFWSYGQL
jgi:hypothetical protein